MNFLKRIFSSENGRSGGVGRIYSDLQTPLSSGYAAEIARQWRVHQPQSIESNGPAIAPSAAQLAAMHVVAYRRAEKDAEERFTGRNARYNSGQFLLAASTPESEWRLMANSARNFNIAHRDLWRAVATAYRGRETSTPLYPLVARGICDPARPPFPYLDGTGGD